MSWISWINYRIYSNKRSTSNCAYLEKAPILEAEKVNKRPPLSFPLKTQISAHNQNPLPFPLTAKKTE